ncbi:hypothetical protein [Paraflavitalea speifideaquila]|uniref:hypothetical protein n=1 Tax=Paraflavitalea speifideaquila TaxID=3076558 RepID=UPI0028E5E14F|nr:hypothetical protein [Paraflavitalea speifideiaquila]
MFVSCQKKQTEDERIATPEQLSNKLTVADAKSYLQRLESKYGNYDLIKKAGKVEKNVKQVDFSHAYIGENETSFFVEAPIAYTTREVVLGTNSGMPNATLNQLFKSSFDRFVVYKDKKSGLVNEKIVTVIPSAHYLSNSRKDLYDNHYQRIDKEFSGYISYRNWKGQFLSSQSFNMGKAAADKGGASNRAIHRQ